MEPLVTIIIPFYMTEAYIERCLLSVINQTHRNIEIILINDGSTDGSASICLRYAEMDKRIVYIEQENKGQGTARDAGLDIAHGEWICFVDSDDWIAPDFVSDLLTAVLKNDCLIAQCFHTKVYNEEPPYDNAPPCYKLFTWRDFWLYDWTDKHLLANLPCDKMYHHSLFSNLRFGDFRLHEDDYFAVRIIHAARSKKIVLVEKCLYFYFYRENSSSKADVSLSNLEGNRAMDAMLRFIRKLNEPLWLKMGLQHCLKRDINNFCILCRDFPDVYEQYAFLRTGILAEKHFIQNTCPQLISFLLGSKKVWENMLENGIILYGWGRKGKRRIYPWLKHFGIPILDIWDKNANGALFDNRPIRFINNEFQSNTLVGISIEDEYQQLLVECDLWAAGYNNLISYAQLESAITYVKLTTYLPELLEDYS